ncbi:hypothetical protein AAJ76_4000037141 [Vairimorpha ceranae]|uniref:SP-RING-type domain-containing protein n=1 Tax=Vairimorpha ceranae TaxID=40302 RepID=A0A0F9WPN4_9MICR|nr:hypothetical protein AAJ76_4000037141 [Vairimorpha ceranae]KAF5141823.1 hypothetical protein G9O61_00g001060 [Vairimorpha ceranae]KKO74903.1 hypothetical protein AAJ76_4000037141 [Vairimorpha ceranae]
MEEYLERKKDLLDEIKKIAIPNSTINELISIHKEILTKKESVLNVKTYKNYLRLIENSESTTDDCEVKHIESELICPFQQIKIATPFRNHCNHVYEREGLEKYVNGRNIKCPVLGCHAIVKLK